MQSPISKSRPASPLLSLLLFVPLVCAVVLTLRAQMFWGANDIMEGFGLVLLWLVLGMGWLLRLGQKGLKRERPMLRDAVLPCAIALLFVSERVHLPLRVLLWSQQDALAQALNRPSLHRHGHGEPIGLITPLQISKSGGATRILLWESGVGVSGTAIGFIHCPNAGGCGSASFAPYFVEWESKARIVPIAKDWHAVSVSGTDF